MLVLIVDDEVAIVDLLAELLTDEGYSVQTAYDGRSALALLRNGLRPAIIVSDIMMPGMDGWAFYQAVRGELGLLNVAFILMSAGRARPVDLADARATFMNKPFSVYEILDTLTRISET
jgi:CheY-like chemotaxis protein